MLFDVIYADPPWRYDSSPVRGSTKWGSVEAHYQPMALEDICSLRVPAARNAVLYLWATAPLLPEGLQVMDSWGFTYKSCGIWDKGQARLGYWFRGQHEHLLVGVRGSWPPPPVHLRTSSIYSEHSGRHSRKPNEIRNRIATWWPDARRLEMFCRYPAPGWHVWGNQVGSEVAGLPFERFDPHSDPAQDALFG